MNYMFSLLIYLLAAATSIQIKDITLQVDLAVTEQERFQGLMGREKLLEGEGMLFVFKKPNILSFWMKDTKIPLSIAFFDECRKIINIEQMDPPIDSILRIYRSGGLARYALEVPQGWFEKNQIGLGDFFEWTDSGKIGYDPPSHAPQKE